MKAQVDRIEIKPGVFIEVSQRLRKKAEVKNGVRLRNRLHEEERKQIFRGMVKIRNKGVKYTKLLLDEAVRIARAGGMKEAVRLTGIKHWSIVQRKRELIMQGKYKLLRAPGGGPRPRYTLAQKQRCVALANQIADKEHCGMRQAFVRAGKILKVNGRSIEWMNFKGMFPPSTPPPP